jgi:hypothetical protein
MFFFIFRYACKKFFGGVHLRRHKKLKKVP